MVELENDNKETKNEVISNIQEETENQNIEEQSLIVEKKKSKIGIIIGIVILAVILLTLSTIFAIINANSNKIVKGIFIENIDVSNLTKEEAKNVLTELAEKAKQNEIVFKYKEMETPITYEALEVSFDIDKTVEEAYEVGRKDNIFKNNFEILKTWINGKNINLNFSFLSSFELLTLLSFYVLIFLTLKHL